MFLDMTTHHPSHATMVGTHPRLVAPFMPNETVLRDQMRELVSLSVSSCLLPYSKPASRIPLLSFPWVDPLPGKRESGLQTFFGSSRSSPSLSCRLGRSDWFNVNALEDLKEIRETYSRG